MPDIKEKLVELLVDFSLEPNAHICDDCGLIPVSEACVEIANHLIANGVTIQQWISVEERLPDLEKEVLVCDIDDDRNYKDVWSLEDDEDGGVVWVSKNGEWYSLDDATHWMPLPEPPKGE